MTKGHRQTRGIWNETLKCQLSASAPLVVQVSKSLPLLPEEGGGFIALALVMPENKSAILIQVGREEERSDLVAISLSALGLTTEDLIEDMNMMSLWKEPSGVAYDEVNASITRTETSKTIVSKILSCLQSPSTISGTQTSAVLANGQPWSVCHVVGGLSDFHQKPIVVPVLTVLGDAGRNPVLAWTGYNVALKPAVEPILLCRAPRAGHTFAQLAVEHGSGALAIDKARINHASPLPDVSFDIRVALRDILPSFEIDFAWRESCPDFLHSALAVLRSDNTGDRDLSRDVSVLDDIPPDDHERGQIKLSRLYPNGIWCGLNLLLVLDLLGDCSVCRRFYDERFHPVQEAAQEGAPSLGDVLEHIYRDLSEPLHSPCLNIVHSPDQIQLFLFSALCALLANYPSLLYSARQNTQTGRWPANLILSHHEDCQKIGQEEIPGYVINRFKSGMKPFGNAAGEEYETVKPTKARLPDRTANPDYKRPDEESPWKMPPGRKRPTKTKIKTGTAHGRNASESRVFADSGFASNPKGDEKVGYADDEGYELVDRWACVPECPVRMLDDSTREAGFHSSGQGNVARYEEGQGLMGYSPAGSSIGYGYDGSAPSRFFYTGKATRGEKDLGLEDFYWKRVDTGFERITKTEYNKLPRRERAHANIHPTVKPLGIIRYLATLVIPPKQEGIIRRILIPFSGSGSEVIGAIQAGWDEALGVEMEAKYNEMAEARMRSTLGMF